MKFASPVLFVVDVPAVIEFYQIAFGAERTFYDQDLQFAELQFSQGKIGISSHKAGRYMMPGSYPAADDSNPQSVELAFFVDDVGTAYRRAVDAGAESLAEPRQMDWGQEVAYVRSLEGTVKATDASFAICYLQSGASTSHTC